MVRQFARDQEIVGVVILDVNMGTNGIDEKATMLDAIYEVISTVDLPLSIDTSYVDVMEAALRTAYEYITGEEAPAQLYDLQPVRGYEGIREATVSIKDLQVNVAVVYGTANAAKLLEQIKSGQKQYHFVEVMTCPGGCIGGGGQPKNIMKDADQVRKARIAVLYARDAGMELRKSHENPEIKQVYEEFYGKPLSEMAEKMLHTKYEDKSVILHRNME